MAVKIKTKYGLIDVSNNVVATVVGSAATSNYGVVGMASKNAIRDGFDGILNKANYKKGVVVKSDADDVTVDVNIIVGYGLKISEVSRNVQDSVKYNLKSQLGIQTKAVNVIVQGVKLLDE
ncbi:MAG: Asp23/Gls24 family envelope stress response protein [Lactobacillus sp.]|nr:Asp23/Gls24 family envelope stress response protein [Lactobacillus sp.]